MKKKTRTKPERKEVAKIVVHGLDNMSIRQINAVAKWLRQKANDLVDTFDSEDRYAPTFTMRFFPPW